MSFCVQMSSFVFLIGFGRCSPIVCPNSTQLDLRLERVLLSVSAGRLAKLVCPNAHGRKTEIPLFVATGGAN
jgi:hypothetical protein